MKKLFFLFLLIPVCGFAQLSDATLLLHDSTQIKQLGTSQLRSWQMFKEVIQSKVNVSNGITTSGLTTNRIPFASSSTTLTDNAALTWNGALFKIGTTPNSFQVSNTGDVIATGLFRANFIENYGVIRSDYITNSSSIDGGLGGQVFIQAKLLVTGDESTETIHAFVNNANTNVISPMLRLTAQYGIGPPASVAGYGTSIVFEAANAVKAIKSTSTLASVYTATTSGTETADLVFKNISAGTLTERLRVTSAGAIGLGGANYGTSGQILTSAGGGAAASWTSAPFWSLGGFSTLTADVVIDPTVLNYSIYFGVGPRPLGTFTVRADNSLNLIASGGSLIFGYDAGGINVYINPLGSARGDMYYHDNVGTFSRLPIGTSNQYLTNNSLDPSWSTYALNLGGDVTTAAAFNVPANAAGVLTNSGSGTLTWAASSGGNPFADNVALVKNSSDATKLLILSASSITTGTTRTWTFPDVNGTVARKDAAQTFTGVQTFSSLPTIPVTPIASTDAVSKGYVDGLTTGPFSTTLNGYTLTSGGAGKLLLGDNTWLSIGSSGKYLRTNGTVPAWATIAESELSFTDITTNNATISAHGFTPKYPNDATKYLDGTGAYSIPAGGSGWATNGTTNLTGPATIAGTPTNIIKFSFPSLNTTSTDGAGLWFQNSTAAAAGAQQVSPSEVYEGQGWKTTATAGTQSVKVKLDNLPIQAGATPTSNFRIQSNINGAGYINDFNFSRTAIGGVQLNIYDSYTNASTYKGLIIQSDYFGAGTGFAIIQDWTSTGTQAMYFGNAQDASVNMRVNAGNRWRFSTSTEAYSIVPGTDNTYDIGVSGANRVRNIYGGNISLGIAGNGILIKEGTNATMGIATLSGGTVTVSTTKVTANSRIITEVQSLGTVTIPSSVGVTSRTAGTSFVITSSAPTDTSVVAWWIFEPAP